MDQVEKATYPLSHESVIRDYVIDPPLTPYTYTDHVDPYNIGVYIYNASFRMQLSYSVLEFLFHASKAPSCTPQQQMLFAQFRHRCVEEIRALAKKVSVILAIRPNIGSPTFPDQPKGSKDEKDYNDLSRTVGTKQTVSKGAHEKTISTGGLGFPVKICLDLEQCPDGKSTLFLTYTESEIFVFRIGFDNAKKI
jgi:hypothetical protein